MGFFILNLKLTFIYNLTNKHFKMERIDITLNPGMPKVLGSSIELNENKRGKVVSYDEVTGESIVVVEESDNTFNSSDMLNS